METIDNHFMLQNHDFKWSQTIYCRRQKKNREKGQTNEPVRGQENVLTLFQSNLYFINNLSHILVWAISQQLPSSNCFILSTCTRMVDLEKISGSAFSLHLLSISIPFKIQWLQIYRRGSMLVARIEGALAPADPVLDPPT